MLIQANSKSNSDTETASPTPQSSRTSETCKGSTSLPSVSHTPKSSHFPKPFPIPDSFGPTVDAFLKENRVNPQVRKEVTHALFMFHDESLRTQSKTYTSSV